MSAALLPLVVAAPSTAARFLALVLSVGVAGALMTGDLSNMFVFIEVILVPAYGIPAVLGTLRRLRSGRIYVTVGLLTSTVFLAGVALVYGAAGTVNPGRLAGEWIIAVIAVAVGLITLMSMLTLWGSVFWSEEPEVERPVNESHCEEGSTAVLVRPRVPTAMLVPCVVSAATALGIGLGAALPLDLSSTVAANLLETSTYVEAVLG
ncbi:proton-conducting transporter transmembrane domain-containing protein [Nocardiopsis xinjiangensis]|uniref:proton-conducting transporter transmembrane domain-containing protein n=1 Tax=Nocardiopsis xinjiangensis TaxID=124285 RepID=UPI0003480AA2|nr:proton-conducting transporter membrane subunit [Nocardiopsis xinjiangensis]